jgi:hypothetical protein
MLLCLVLPLWTRGVHQNIFCAPAARSPGKNFAVHRSFIRAAASARRAGFESANAFFVSAGASLRWEHFYVSQLEWMWSGLFVPSAATAAESIPTGWPAPSVGPVCVEAVMSQISSWSRLRTGHATNAREIPGESSAVP